MDSITLGDIGSVMERLLRDSIPLYLVCFLCLRYPRTPPTNGLPTCRSSSILIKYLAETHTARPLVGNHRLFCTLERIPQTELALMVISSLLFHSSRSWCANLITFMRERNRLNIAVRLVKN